MTETSLLRRLAVPLALLIALAVVGCSDPVTPGATPPTTGSSSAPSTTAPSSTPSAPASSAPPAQQPDSGPNDLAKNPLKRELSAAPLTAKVSYGTSLPIKDWRPQVVKPLRVVVTAVNGRTKNQKIYLSRLTASVTAYDESGVVDGPKAITDTANISPGYFVTDPTEYGQTLLLPAVDDGSIRLTIDFTYEFVAQVSSDKAPNTQRDFAKQTATDRISIPLVRG